VGTAFGALSGFVVQSDTGVHAMRRFLADTALVILAAFAAVAIQAIIKHAAAVG
jgi:hypothetical protein